MKWIVMFLTLAAVGYNAAYWRYCRRSAEGKASAGIWLLVGTIVVLAVSNLV